jgi:hypothetical protein
VTIDALPPPFTRSIKVGPLGGFGAFGALILWRFILTVTLGLPLAAVASAGDASMAARHAPHWRSGRNDMKVPRWLSCFRSCPPHEPLDISPHTLDAVEDRDQP